MNYHKNIQSMKLKYFYLSTKYYVNMKCRNITIMQILTNHFISLSMTNLESAMSGNLEQVIVAHKDRLSRFCYGLIKWIIEFNGGELVVLDDENAKSSEQELAEDLLSIIHIFSCKQMGKRKYKKHEDKVETNTTTEENYK